MMFQPVPTGGVGGAFPPPSTLANFRAALRELPHVWIYDNDDLSHSFRLIAVFEQGRVVTLNKPVPKWLQPMLG